MRPPWVHAAALFLCSVGPLGAQARGTAPAPSLQDFLSAPFASELVASPTGGKVAWMQNVLGERSIWIAEPPAYQGRLVTRYPGDQGRYLVQLEFTPDGTHILYTLGGAHSGRRLPEPPNPTMDPAGGREEVWIVSAAGGDPVRIDDGNWPAVSPRGDLVAYLKNEQIWAAPLTRDSGGRVVPGAPRRLFVDRGIAAPQGNVASLHWSPTANKLAFISLRDQHSFIGVYDADANSLIFLDPSTDRDQWPVWAPDGSRIAFVRIPSFATLGPQTASGAERVPQPWSIRVADARTGTGKELWRARRGMGSAFGFGFFNNARQLYWGAGDRIVFPWEGTGFAHMYSIAASGGEPVDLTPGSGFEVEHVALSPDGRELIFMSNQDDVDRRHFWRVPIASGPPQPVTTGSGIEYWPVFTSDGRALAFLATGPRTPPQVELLRLADAGRGPATVRDRQVLAPGIAPDRFPAAAMVEPRQVIFPAADGWQIHGQLYLPPDYRAGVRYPALVYLHGGPNSQMVLGYHYHRYDYYHKPYGLNQYLANRGYIVLSVNYRRGTGYGVEFREALDRSGIGPRAGRDVVDIIAGGEYLRGRSDVDPERVGIWGGSAGGGRTVLAMAVAPELFAAGFNLHGVASMADGKTAGWKAPLLIVHGDDDRNAVFTQSVALVSDLRSRGIEGEVVVLPNEIHSFLLHSSWVRAFEAAADFFDRRIMQRAPGPARE